MCRKHNLEGLNLVYIPRYLQSNNIITYFFFFSELESDTESLLEAKVPYRSPHMKAALAKQQAEMAKAKRQKNKTKK